MKDALGHGSNPRDGGMTPVQQENAPFVSRLSKAAGHSYLDPNDPRGAHSSGILQVTAPMQRRQYEAIAGAINHLPDNPDVPDMKAQVAQHFANALQGTNSHFDTGRFKNAAMTGNMGRTKNADPGMQRRHYEAVASTIGSLPSSWRDPVANHFARELGRSNSNFNSDRFVKAAGGTPARDFSGRTVSDIKRDYKP